MTDALVRNFLEVLSSWYKKHKRGDLPWRQKSFLSPYAIVASEVMLQQTQVSRVISYFLRWMEVFPDVYALSNADLHIVLQNWQGLGYNNRGMRLQKMAQQIVSEYSGVFPEEKPQLEKLPGLGPYTAGAVMAFAYNKKSVFIETNIRRVIIHRFFADATLPISDKDIMAIVESLLDVCEEYGFDARNFYWAMMDYGSHMKSSLKENPNRKSTTYTKQSAFKGSFREKRSAVLRYLLDKKQATEDELFDIFQQWSQEDILDAVNALVRDGLVVAKEGNWSIRG
jgi:A/G-specific adenine glycosylase